MNDETVNVWSLSLPSLVWAQQVFVDLGRSEEQFAAGRLVKVFERLSSGSDVSNSEKLGAALVTTITIARSNPFCSFAPPDTAAAEKARLARACANVLWYAAQALLGEADLFESLENILRNRATVVGGTSWSLLADSLHAGGDLRVGGLVSALHQVDPELTMEQVANQAFVLVHKIDTVLVVQ